MAATETAALLAELERLVGGRAPALHPTRPQKPRRLPAGPTSTVSLMDVARTEPRPRRRLRPVASEPAGAGLTAAAEHDQDAWVARYDAERASYSSASLFCEVKLSEAVRLTAEAELPNSFRTSVAVDLLGSLAGHLHQHYGDMLPHLFHEIARSIFVDVPRRVSLSQLTASRTFFDEARELRQQLTALETQAALLRAERSRYRSERARRNGLLGLVTRKLGRRDLRTVLRAWHSAAHRARAERAKLLRLLRARVQVTPRAVFAAWRDVAAALRSERDTAALSAQQARVQELELEMEQAVLTLTDKDSEIDELRALLDTKLGDGASRRVSRRASHMRQNRQGSVTGFGGADRLQQLQGLIENLGTALVAVGDTTLRRLRRTIAEVRQTPDAQLLAALLHRRGRHGSTLEAVAASIGAEAVAAFDGFGVGPGSDSSGSDSSDDDHDSAAGEREPGDEAAEEEEDIPAPVAELLDMKPEQVLLLWVNWVLGRATVRGRPYMRRVTNFAEDLADGEALLVLATELDGGEPDLGLAPRERLLAVGDALARLEPPGHQLLHPEQVENLDAKANAALLCRLFVSHSALVPSADLRREAKRVDVLDGDWARIRLTVFSLSSHATALGAEVDIPATVAALRGFTQTLAAMDEALSTMLASARFGHRQFLRLQARVLDFQWSLYLAQIRQQDVEMEDLDEQRTRQAFTDVGVHVAGLVDGSGVDGEGEGEGDGGGDVVAEVRAVFQAHHKELSRIFRYYSAGTNDGQAFTMNAHEWWKLVKDCKIASKQLPSAVIDIIFQQADQLEDAADDPNNPTRQLVPAEFVDALVRVAARKYASGGAPLAARVTRLLSEHILPNAMRSNTEGFRRALAEPAVHEVYHKHRVVLRRLFRYYSALEPDPAAARHTNTMSEAEMMRLLRDGRMLDDSLSQIAVRGLFAAAQQDSDYMPGALGAEQVGGGAGELIYEEFLEMVTAVACYKVPSPYLPLASRLDEFVTSALGPLAAKKVPRGPGGAGKSSRSVS